MKIMVTGARGLLGQEVIRALLERGHACLGVSSADFDLCDAAATRRAVSDWQPEAIIHCAGYTAVDRAESEPARCMVVNSLGTLNLVRAALRADAKLLYVSTDYVFDGSGDAPRETGAPTGPLNVYGLSKLQGEETVRALMTKFFILRTSWMFGMGGGNFVRTMLCLGSERPRVNVVCDQFGAPTYAPDLAQLICQIIESSRYGVYHGTNEGCCSFAEFANAIMQQGGRRCQVTPIPSSAYPCAARRPLNSRLSKRSLDLAGFRRLPPWEDALARYLTELKNHNKL
ncbi:MAG: dTDP-4-dehydrorhamnose reductase [Clostridia bacterium]|nr:dTDP-4-dehydrorhamnose reductase [Clostridia bacterium]